MKPLSEVVWSERTRAEMQEWAEKGTVVIVPIASTEQHGRHLPLDTDQRILDHVVHGAARRLDDVPVLVAPTIPYGVSPHHMVYSGTITLSVGTTVRLLKEVCQSIVSQGFDHIVIVSGHGGNRGTVDAAALELRHELRRQITGICWFDLAIEGIDAVTEGPSHNIGHAGETETSAILALRPDLVRANELHMTDDITDDPSIGTAEKGERILEAGIQILSRYIREITEMPGRQVVAVARAEY